MWVRRGLELGDLHCEGKSDGAADPAFLSNRFGRVGMSKKNQKIMENKKHFENLFGWSKKAEM